MSVGCGYNSIDRSATAAIRQTTVQRPACTFPASTTWSLQRTPFRRPLNSDALRRRHPAACRSPWIVARQGGACPATARRPRRAGRRKPASGRIGAEEGVSVGRAPSWTGRRGTNDGAGAPPSATAPTHGATHALESGALGVQVVPNLVDAFRDGLDELARAVKGLLLEEEAHLTARDGGRRCVRALSDTIALGTDSPRDVITRQPQTRGHTLSPEPKKYSSDVRVCSFVLKSETSVGTKASWARRGSRRC